MKKLITVVTCAICLTTANVMAQGPQQTTPEQRVAMIKERLKEVGLTPAQMDSVVVITEDMRSKMSGFRELSQEERQTKMKEATDARNKRLEKALPAELAKKLIDLLSQQRQGGGRPGGGNRK